MTATDIRAVKFPAVIIGHAEGGLAGKAPVIFSGIPDASPFTRRAPAHTGGPPSGAAEGIGGPGLLADEADGPLQGGQAPQLAIGRPARSPP